MSSELELSAADVVEILTLERLEDNLFRGQSRDFVGKRVFGGQVLGQAMRAAGYTTDRPAHSLHAYFLLAGDISAPIVYDVEHLREGKSFVTRQVRAIQYGRTIFSALVSFAPIEDGLDFQEEMPDVPNADELDSEQVYKASIASSIPEPIRTSFMRERPFEFRPTRPSNPYMPVPEDPERAFWMRLGTGKRLPDEPGLHQAILAFASDYNLMRTGLMPHGISLMSPNLQAASLDHSIYFHYPARADEWFLYDMRTHVTSNARSLNTGRMWQNGRLVISTVQEGLMRMREYEER